MMRTYVKRMSRSLALIGALLGSLVAQSAPTVSLTSPTSGTVVINPPGSFTLTANASDANGIAKVEFYSGTSLIATDTTAPYSYAWNNVSKGSYTLTAKATSTDGSSTTSTAVTVIVNAKPTVSLTMTQGVFSPGAVPLTATAADSDGTVAQVAFYADGTLLGTDTSSPYAFTWSNATAGVYMITAQATDNRGAVTTSAATPVVVGLPPTVTLTSPTANQSYGAPATVALSATATANGGATLWGVRFYNGTTLITEGTETSPGVFTASWTNVPAGSYSIKADAYDSSTLHTATAPVPITVGTTSPPTVSLTAPTANQTYTAPASVTLTATASASSGGTISKVEFYQGTTLIGTATTAPYAITWASVPAGSYSLTAKATDSRGLTTTTAATSITVTAAGMQVYYIQTDHLDTPRLITNSSNQVVWRNLPTTEPFGATPPEEDPQATGNHFRFNLRFPGQYADKETNTNYNTFRDYDPQIGRYIESDPIGLKGGINTYSYVRGNPVSRIDSLGLSDLIYNNDTGHLLVIDKSGNVSSYDAANNAQRSSRGPWDAGTYDYAYHTTHRDDGADSPYGSSGNFVFTVPECDGCGVHSGRANKKDRAGRSGVGYATNGCIRTTDAATEKILDLTNNGDPVKTLTVIRNLYVDP